MSSHLELTCLSSSSDRPADNGSPELVLVSLTLTVACMLCIHAWYTLIGLKAILWRNTSVHRVLA